MDSFWTIAGAVLGAILSALTVGAMVRGFLERYTRRVFAEDVRKALESEKPWYREFHEGVFASELERGRRTADIAQGLARDIQAHIGEFQRFRSSYEGHQEQLVLIPKTVVHLDETIRRLDMTIANVGEAVHSTREELARLKGVVEARA